MANKLKIVGVTVSITFVMLIALAIFIKAIGVIFNDWFSAHAVSIAIISGIIVFIGVVTGAISIGALTSKGKGFLG